MVKRTAGRGFGVSLCFIVPLPLMGGCVFTRPVTRTELVGLYQYPERGAWIELRADGSALQCRTPDPDRAIWSRGRWSDGGSVRWYDIWDTDRISGEPHAIAVDGKWGTFRYVRTLHPMGGKCGALADP